MEIERETLVEIAVSTVTVGAFIAVMMAIGVVYNENGFGADGAFALIGSIVLFIFVMAGVGYWLSGRY